MKKIAMLAIAGTTSLGMFAAVPTASAAHCVDDGEPGFSYFGTDHVKEADHNEGFRHGADETTEGTPGASGCRDASDPSTRAPGRNKG